MPCERNFLSVGELFFSMFLLLLKITVFSTAYNSPFFGARALNSETARNLILSERRSHSIPSETRTKQQANCLLKSIFFLFGHDSETLWVCDNATVKPYNEMAQCKFEWPQERLLHFGGLGQDDGRSEGMLIAQLVVLNRVFIAVAKPPVNGSKEIIFNVLSMTFAISSYLMW